MIEKSNNTVKEFNYKKGGVTLNFKLNLDNKKEIESFLRLLEVAQEDVTKEITWQQ